MLPCGSSGMLRSRVGEQFLQSLHAAKQGYAERALDGGDGQLRRPEGLAAAHQQAVREVHERRVALALLQEPAQRPVKTLRVHSISTGRHAQPEPQQQLLAKRDVACGGAHEGLKDVVGGDLDVGDLADAVAAHELRVSLPRTATLALALLQVLQGGFRFPVPGCDRSTPHARSGTPHETGGRPVGRPRHDHCRRGIGRRSNRAARPSHRARGRPEVPIHGSRRQGLRHGLGAGRGEAADSGDEGLGQRGAACAAERLSEDGAHVGARRSRDQSVQSCSRRSRTHHLHGPEHAIGQRPPKQRATEFARAPSQGEQQLHGRRDEYRLCVRRAQPTAELKDARRRTATQLGLPICQRLVAQGLIVGDHHLNQEGRHTMQHLAARHVRPPIADQDTDEQGVLRECALLVRRGLVPRRPRADRGIGLQHQAGTAE
mmetsp:Transcript_113664/g.361099  ORF Transcript_113664/g.361099 Transcript_113664/m.361099 type:complete len:431 (+) Transcript_113664:3539-4831(+)